MTGGWIQQVNARGVWDVALGLGLQRYDRAHLGPCPACGAERRSRRDARPGPVFLVGRGGWKCGQCGEGGSALTLVCYRAVGVRLAQGDPRWREVREACASRGWCEPHPGAPDRQDWQPAPPPVAAPVLEPSRAPLDELVELWEASAPVVDDAEVAEWLARRGLPVERIAELDLARALPTDGWLPRWARFRSWPWSEGWRCIVRCWGATGELESLRARWVRPSSELPDGAEKAGAAAAGTGSASGMVLACGLGRQLLETGERPTWWPSSRPLQIVIVEGEPDWLTWATRWPVEAAEVPAVLGVWNGAWSDEIADRIPDGARVIVRVHHDEAGDRYARRILRTLAGRVDLFRSRGRDAG